VDFDAQRLKTRGITQGCAFSGSTRRLTTLKGSNFPKPSKFEREFDIFQRPNSTRINVQNRSLYAS